MMSGIISGVAGRRALIAALLVSTALAGAPHQAARAQDATWLAAPGTADMLDAANWSSGAVPTGTATFAPSSTTNLTLGGNRTFGGWTFAADAPAYSIAASGILLTFTGAGFVVNGATPTITNSGRMEFWNNSSAGSAALVNNLIMHFKFGSSAGSAAITNNGTFTFQDTSNAGSATITNNSQITFQSYTGAGSAAITNTGTGTLSFQDFSSAGSATITNSSGNLDFRNTSTAGSAAITNNGTLQFYDTSSAGSATITNNIGMHFWNSSSAGSAAITNNLVMSFRNSSSAGSAAITNNKSLYFIDNSSAGSSTIINSSQVYFQDTSSAGSAAITNNDLMEFESSSTAGSATIVNNSSLRFGGFGGAGSATITNNGVLRFGFIASAGSATITNNNIMEFQGGSTGGSAAITNANGSLNFFNTSTAGSATITNNSALQFYDTSSAGSAAITNNAATQFLNGSTAGAATIVNNLDLGFGDTSSAGSATITNNGDLTFGSASSTGTATITGAGAINLATTDTAGAATVTLQSGGALSGYGAVGNTTVQSGATFQPLGGTLHVNGTLTLGAGSVYRFTPGGLAAVTGTATLGGAGLQFSQTPGFLSQTYTVLTAAGGVSGTFTLDALHAGVGSVLYGTNDVTLTINGYRSGAALGGSGGTNARSVAAALDRVIDASGGAPPASLNPLLGLYGASLANSLNSLSGEAATGAQSTAFSTSSTFLGIMLDPMAGARGATAAAPGSSLIQMADNGVTPAARVAAGWSVWTKSFGQAGRAASDAGTGAAGTATSLYGVAAGADRLISPGTLVGFALAGGGTSYGLGARGTGTGDFAQVGLYGATRLGPGYVSAALAYGWNRFDVSRSAGLGPLETYRSAPVAHSFGGRIEAGRRFGTRAFAATPYAALEAIGASTAAYRETWAAPDTGAFALAYAARTSATARAEAGVRLDSMHAVAPTADLLTFARFAYAWQAGTQRSAEASFQQLANSGFTVFGARASTHTMLASLGAELRLASGARVTASLDGELGDRHRSLRANLGLRQSW